MQFSKRKYIIFEKKMNYLSSSEYRFLFLILVFNLLVQFSIISITQAEQINKCTDIFINSGKSLLKKKEILIRDSKITVKDLVDHTIKGIDQVPEFQFLRKAAKQMNVRVWLFGGTASSFLHYVKWDLVRSRGQINLQKDRFDYDYTNIFRSTQDLDIVIDATPEVAYAFQKIIEEKYPQFLGAKAKWEVRTLRHRMGEFGEIGFKEALLNDPDFNNQDTDSNSLGMVELTFNKNQNQIQEPIIRDLKTWDQPYNSVFLSDTLNNRISYFRSQKHFTTSRAKSGENPEILSVIRLLVKAFQYELEFSPSDFSELKTIINEFHGTKITNNNALRRIHETAKKLVMHAVNVEYAVNKLDELGLRQKLITMGNVNEINSDAWWLNREPLRSFPVGSGSGLTAADLELTIVAHETNNFLAFESITRSHSGEPNVFISRKIAVGETAVFGEGFYTRIGKVGQVGAGLTIRFIVNPEARQGTDFIVEGDYIIFKNKKSITVIQESLNVGVDDILKLAESNEEFIIEDSDLGLLEKLKRKMNATLINNELNKLLNSQVAGDQERLIHILNSFQNSSIEKLISKDVLGLVATNVFGRLIALAQSSNEADLMRYIMTVGPILKVLDSKVVLKKESFFNYLYKLIQTPSLSFNLRKQAVFELMLSSEDFEQHLNFKKNLQPNDLNVLASEVRAWDRAQDPRKRKFAFELNKKWSEFIENGEVKRLESIINSQFFDINHKNISQFSVLQLAVYYKQQAIVDWLISNPIFDFYKKNSLGFTEVDQLRLSGKGELADVIDQKQSNFQAQKFKVRERNTEQKSDEYPNGSPIIDFVRIESGSFMMGDGEAKVLTTISKPFEIMSVDVTQKIYRIIVELLKENFRTGEYNEINSTPSRFKGESHPVEQVSYDDVSLWKKGLNELSKLDNIKVQQVLESLFNGHKRGDEYGRPSEAQWEYTSRLGGLADSDFSHGKGEVELSDYAVYYGSGTQPVGLKKPVFYNGKPIYDLHGNVWKWIEDWYGQNLAGSIDPQGVNSGTDRIIRGGSWINDFSQKLRSGDRAALGPFARRSSIGFRLVRIIP
jgi:formylglycine-generating enzyme required for sulfatase activity